MRPEVMMTAKIKNGPPCVRGRARPDKARNAKAETIEMLVRQRRDSVRCSATRGAENEGEFLRDAVNRISSYEFGMS